MSSTTFLPQTCSHQILLKSINPTSQVSPDHGEQNEIHANRKANESLAIDLRELSFSYRDGKTVLDNLSWQVPSGSFALLFGHSGSGKTTLLRLLKPELIPLGTLNGQIVILSHPLDRWKQQDSAMQIAYLSQDPQSQIVCDTVCDELAFGLENLGMKDSEIRCRIAGVSQFLGLTDLINRRCSELSSGEIQSVALASSLALEPRLLLLDEPTAHLDPITAKNFLHALFRINHELGITVIASSHSPEAYANYASNYFLLKEGQLSSIDPEDVRYRSQQKIYCWARPSPPSAATAITLHDIWFHYGHRGCDILRGTDLEIKQGCIHALIGANGSGKSTALRLMAGIYHPQHGRVKNPLQASQALLPSHPKALFACETVEEELAEWQHEVGYSDNQIAKAIQSVGLNDVLQLNPYDLSGGQQQLLAFIKIALCNPRLLLLDEPTNYLDADSRIRIAKSLTLLADRGSTVVVVTHDLSFVSRIADHISLLFDGQIACTQPPAEFSITIFFIDHPMMSLLSVGMLRRYEDIPKILLTCS